MVNLSEEEILHLAGLAKLVLQKEEVKKFQEELSTVISYVKNLSEVETIDVEPLSQTTGLENVTREDMVKPQDCLTLEEALSGTDNAHNNLFKVPAILDK